MADELSNPAATGDERLPATVTVIQTAFCGSLRSKKFFMLDGLATDAAQYLDASNHCWCGETQQVIGPDGGRATPQRCTPGRSCYTSGLEQGS